MLLGDELLRETNAVAGVLAALIEQTHKATLIVVGLPILTATCVLPKTRISSWKEACVSDGLSSPLFQQDRSLVCVLSMPWLARV